MFSLKHATILALFGIAFAAPTAHRGHYRQNDNSPEGGRMEGNFGFSGPDVVTITVTAGANVPTATMTVGNGGAAPAAPTITPVSTGVPSTGSSSGQTGYMAVVSEWRSKMGMSALTHDSTLEANALKTCQDGHGQMKHELNPGSMAQVLAPGTADNFEHVFVGGWLCEVPTLPGLNGICATQSKGWTYGGQTGHADILSSKSYSKIGCALADGIWGCDLA